VSERLRYLSVCSGIEAATVAWHPLGWTPVAFSEIDKFPAAVLAHHYPNVPNWGDMTKFKDWPDAAIDLLVGGTPCQSFSVAGLRKGLADPRGNLMLTYLAIADRYRPRWLVWENVPGVLSSGGGRDFGSFLGALGELGYGWVYRSLDAQYFNLAQRRERVFVVGCLGSRHGAAAVLLERASLSGHPAPRREAGKGIANCLTDRPDRGGGNSEGQRLIARAILTGEGNRQDYETTALVADTLRQHPRPGSNSLGAMVAHSLRADGFDASEDGTGRGTPLVPVPHTDVMLTMRAASSGAAHEQRSGDTRDDYVVPVAFSCKDPGNDVGEVAPTLRSMGHDGSHANAGGQVAIGFYPTEGRDVVGYREQSPAVKVGSGGTSGNPPGVGLGMQVRRLTPRECERLQGFPDNYTLIPYRGKLAADGPRYKAIGNSMAVPVMAWIGRRIAAVEAIAP